MMEAHIKVILQEKDINSTYVHRDYIFNAQTDRYGRRVMLNGAQYQLFSYLKTPGRPIFVWSSVMDMILSQGLCREIERYYEDLDYFPSDVFSKDIVEMDSSGQTRWAMSRIHFCRVNDAPLFDVEVYDVTLFDVVEGDAQVPLGAIIN